MNIESEINLFKVNQYVQRALDRPSAQITNWKTTALNTGFGPTTGGLYRLNGEAEDRNETFSWSLILKILQKRDDPADDDPDDKQYWKREALAYDSGFLDELPGGLAAPVCFEIEERSSDSVWLWLEDIQEDKPDWELTDYGTAAYHLGTFNGFFSVTHPLTNDSWMSRGWLRRWTPMFEQGMETVRNPETWRDPIIKSAFPLPVAERVLQLWEERSLFLNTLDRLPQTVCHRDAWRGNLFLRERPGRGTETVAIDWAYAGIGAVGEEIAELVCGKLFLEDGRDADSLEKIALYYYREGLKDSGWKRDLRQIRLGYLIAGAMRWGIAVPWWLWYATDEDARERVKEKMNRPIEELLDQWARGTYFLLDRADEARSLINELAI